MYFQVPCSRASWYLMMKKVKKMVTEILKCVAIAEENTASSEEVSANVANYTEAIKKLTLSIMEFKKLTEQFNEDMDKYKI